MADDAAAAASADDPECQWQPVHFLSKSPGSRVFPSAVVHDDSLYVFGGHDGSVYCNDLLVFGLESRSWELELKLSGDAPSPRDAHAAITHGGNMYVFGGYDSKRYLNDFHAFNFASATWSTVNSTDAAPSPRGGHTAVVHRDTMLVFGGCDGWNYFNDLYSFSFLTDQWLAVKVTGTAPGARSAPATVIHESASPSGGEASMFVFGGYDGGRSLNDMFRFCLSTSVWTLVRVVGKAPSPRGGHTAVVHGSTMFTFGGKSGRSPFHDLHAFHFDRSCWESVETGKTAPSPRCAHLCVVHRASLFVFGGYDGRRYFDDCFELALEKPAFASVFSLSGDLEPMVNNQQFSDVSFVVEGRTIYAHKFILFARSEYFRRMFTSGYRESSEAAVSIPGVSYDVFLCVLSFLYTGKARDISAEMALEVLGVANLYTIEPLKRICVDLIKSSLTVANVASILHQADMYGVLHLRTTCINFMVANFAAVIHTDAFQQLVSSENRALVLLLLDEVAARMPAPLPGS